MYDTVFNLVWMLSIRGKVALFAEAYFSRRLKAVLPLIERA